MSEKTPGNVVSIGVTSDIVVGSEPPAFAEPSDYFQLLKAAHPAGMYMEGFVVGDDDEDDGTRMAVRVF
jgi:hypothetical protein